MRCHAASPWVAPLALISHPAHIHAAGKPYYYRLAIPGGCLSPPTALFAPSAPPAPLAVRVCVSSCICAAHQPPYLHYLLSYLLQ